MTQESRWKQHCNQVMLFMEKNGRRPSKYVPEERAMLNWVKYVRKRMRRGLLSEEQTQLFVRLQQQADSLRRLNQYAYGYPKNKQQEQVTQLSLFED